MYRVSGKLHDKFDDGTYDTKYRSCVTHCEYMYQCKVAQ
jgi:hypothetical protein